MAADNKTATLQIGDQVPIVTQSAVGVGQAGAPVVNSVAYRDTGVILNITPRISDKGSIMLDIQQEVSSAVDTTTSSINSPTIKQRKVKTTVVVNDGQVITLGGIVQSQLSKSRSQVPGLGDIPLFGAAFRHKSNSIGKTELIILITPRVVKDADEAREVTDEYRRKLNIYMPNAKNIRHSTSNTVNEIFQ